MARLRGILTHLHHQRVKATAWRARGRETLDATAMRSAAGLYRAADRLAAIPFRTEAPSDAEPDVLDDLVAYTALPRSVVEDLVRNRHPTDFRGEWHATPPQLRADHWFYLSAKSYLFANAVHFAGRTEVDAVADLLPPGATVLEFGAGTGNLSVALGRRGHVVVADELCALQRDFIRFRVHRRGLGSHVSVLDPWTAPTAGSADAITAFDVLEHLADGRGTLDDRLLPALRPGGLLIENSPFVVNASNPMHHEDWGLESHLELRGLSLERVGPDGTRVWRAASV